MCSDIVRERNGWSSWVPLIALLLLLAAAALFVAWLRALSANLPLLGGPATPRRWTSNDYGLAGGAALILGWLLFGGLHLTACVLWLVVAFRLEARQDEQWRDLELRRAAPVPSGDGLR